MKFTQFASLTKAPAKAWTKFFWVNSWLRNSGTSPKRSRAPSTPKFNGFEMIVMIVVIKIGPNIGPVKKASKASWCSTMALNSRIALTGIQSKGIRDLYLAFIVVSLCIFILFWRCQISRRYEYLSISARYKYFWMVWNINIFHCWHKSQRSMHLLLTCLTHWI